MRRFLVKASVVILALLAIVCGAVYVSLRRSLPQIDGVLTVTGISAAIDVVRDADAIPHIFASTRLDALYGLGYVHAQDRLWQMEFQRRIGFGRLSEVLGPAAVPQDRFLRTVGFGRAARAAWASMADGDKREVNAYVGGINAFLASHHGIALPPEFTLLRFEPEPWSGADVLAWVKMMAWDLSANYTFELLRHDIVRAVGEQKLAELMPPYPKDGLSILASFALSRSREPQALRSAVAGRPEGLNYDNASWFGAFASSLSTGDPAVQDLLLGSATSEGRGSNNWVVDGTLTASGRPLLANDPHLGTRLPSVWYLAHMSAGEFDVIGATLPGAPAVALGRNRFIAWGATNVAADVEDLYRETLDPTGRFAEFRGGQEPLQVVSETIVVKGAAPIHLDVRVSRHGPLVSDAINANYALQKRNPAPPPVEPLAFRWTALDSDDTTLSAFLRLNDARNWNQFTAALRDFVVPSQNFVYADVDGHIGYYAPGRIPIRARGDGSLPADGSQGDAEWIGWIPFDELPHAYDPPEHFIVTANNRPAPASYPHLLGLEWPEPYRAQRITDLLHQAVSRGSKLTPDDFASMQADTVSLHARALLPLLLSHAHPESAADAQAVTIARSWDDDARADSAATAIFEAWFLRLAPAIVGDELGPIVIDGYQSRFTYITRMAAGVLATNDNPWCDDARTARRETCDDAVSAALHEAVVQLTRQLAGDMARWRWDGAHRAVFPHQGLDAVAALRPWLSRSVPGAGDWSTVDVGPVSTDHPLEQRSVPSYREIIDLSPQNDSRFLDAIGESGHPLSRHYDDFLADWKAVKHRRMRTDRGAIEQGALGHLRLQPPQR